MSTLLIFLIIILFILIIILTSKLFTNIEKEYYMQVNKNYISYRERTNLVKEQKRIKQRKKKK